MANEKFIPTINEFITTYQYGVIIKDSVFLRTDANSRSDVIIEILYAEQVEIIDAVPYWYKVKYRIQEKEYTGWISKISIRMEN